MNAISPLPKERDYFDLVRSEIHPLLPPRGATRILDVGCGTGATAHWLKSIYPGAWTVGIEGNPTLLARLSQNVDEARIVDLNGPLPEIGRFDLVLLLDVLEHLVDPARLLAYVANITSKDGTIIISLPNVAYFRIALDLFLLGTFDYKDAGILDRTHLRFYYRKSAIVLVEAAGLEITAIRRNGLDNRHARRSNRLLNGLTGGLLRDRFTEQYLFAARHRACTTANSLPTLSATTIEPVPRTIRQAEDHTCPPLVVGDSP